MSSLRTTKAVLTDSHFLIPLVVLLLGIILLIRLH
ncbi:translocated intimin receptor Tir [Paracidobacterium acidisoli]|nr:translocated intimin receptor Tir [Paracidobacterium acidisoli]MBT9329716.1 translocated intimin receptor Tir [Paracidobacterium acidisoli]